MPGKKKPPETKYMFMSFGSIHTGKALGACIIECEDPHQANDKVKELGLMPEACNKAFGYPMTEADVKEQGMNLNKFYSADEMAEMGFSKG